MKKSYRQILACAVLLCAAGVTVPNTEAVASTVSIEFSGGNGAPLTLEIDAPVTYQITSAPQDDGTFFVFQGADPSGAFNTSGSASLSYSDNGGTGYTLDTALSSATAGSVMPGNLVLYSSADPGLDNGFASFAVGDTITLFPGTFTGAGNYAGAPPASGSFQSFVADNSGTDDSGPAVSAVPEPGTWALIAVGVVCLGLRRLRCRAGA